MIDYYKLLNVSINASDEDIRKGYYKMIKRWHPDVNNTDKNLAEIMARQINEAYGILSNPGKRAEYNLKISEKAGDIYTIHRPSQHKRDDFSTKKTKPQNMKDSENREKLLKWAQNFSRYIEIHPWSRKVYDDLKEDLKLKFIAGDLTMEDVLEIYGNLAIEKSNMGLKSNYYAPKAIKGIMENHNSPDIALRTISMMEVLMQVYIRINYGLIRAESKSDGKYAIIKKILMLHEFLEKNPDKFFIGIKKVFITKDDWAWMIRAIN